MKLSGAAAARFCAKPDPAIGAALLHGPDPVLIAESRRSLVAAVTEGDDLRLEHVQGADARRDPALVGDALRAQAFFPGRRIVLVEGATDGLAAGLKPILVDLVPADALLLLTADALAARSALRKLFEAMKGAASLGLYPEPPGMEEISRRLATAGFTGTLAPDAEAALHDAAGELDAGSLGQLVTKIALYAIDEPHPLTAADIAALAPATQDAELDGLIAAVAGGQAERVPPLLQRLTAQGTNPTGMVIAASRHFRQVHAAAIHPGGIEAGIAALRPPAFGPRRDAIASQARRWGTARLESALHQLLETDRTLRSAGTRPDMAILERCLLRLSMMAGR